MNDVCARVFFLMVQFHDKSLDPKKKEILNYWLFVLITRSSKENERTDKCNGVVTITVHKRPTRKMTSDI